MKGEWVNLLFIGFSKVKKKKEKKKRKKKEKKGFLLKDAGLETESVHCFCNEVGASVPPGC